MPNLSPAHWMNDPKRGAAMGRPSTQPKTAEQLTQEALDLDRQARTARMIGDATEGDECQSRAQDLRAEAYKIRSGMYEPVKVTLQRISINRGGYDAGGAYWGTGQRLYWAGSDDGTLDVFFRAADRDAAKRHVLSLLPNARFYR